MGKYFINGQWYTELGRQIALNDAFRKVKESLEAYIEFHAQPYPAHPNVKLLGEWWTPDEICDPRISLSCIYEGVDVPFRVERILALQKRGLVSDVTQLPGRGRYANRCTFEWLDKLENLVKASKEKI